MTDEQATVCAAGPLAGITVIELGHSVAAPYAALTLADLGARVIKVENPGAGDYARGWGPPFWGGSSSLFAAFNRGKESISVDFNNADDVAGLKALMLTEADAVIQNLRPGLLEKFGLSGDEMTAKNPSLIWCDIGAFGSVGPLASKPGYDPLVQASTGIMSVTGEGGRPPVRVGVSIVDIGAGMWTVIGMLSALIARARTGKGGIVATSLYETGLAWMTVPLAGYAASGEVRKPHGSGTAEIVPYQAFEARDGWIMIAAGNDNLFAKLCRMLGRPELADDPAYKTNPARVRNRETIIGLITDAVKLRTVNELGVALDEAGVPNAPLLDVAQVARHPQTEALGMARTCDGDTLKLMGIPLTFDGHRYFADRPAPALGADNPEPQMAKRVS